MRHSDPLQRATTRRDGLVVRTWSDEQFRRQRDADLATASVGPWPMVRAVLGCLAAASLLASGHIVDVAERMQFGARRDRWLTMAEGVDRVANFFSLNRPDDLIADLRGRDVGDRIETIDDLVEDAGTPAPPATSTTSPATTIAGTPGSTTPSTVTTTTVPPPPPPMRSVTAAQPLTLLVAGDSQAEFLGQALTNLGADRGGLLSVTLDFRISTGLARPDYFNWPAQLQAVTQGPDPEAIVFFIGGNDTQDMESAQGRLREDSPEWQAEYLRRAAITMDLVSGEGRHLFWVLQPPVADDDEQDGVLLLNDAVRTAAEGRRDVTVIEADRFLAGFGGSYEPFLETDQGSVERVRQDDGVHLTRTGSAWLAREVYAALGTRWTFN